MSASRPGDWDLQLPAWLRHSGPVAIGLFFLLVTLSGYSVFWGFDERQPGTRLSLLLMIYVCVLCLAAARNPAVEGSARLAGWVLGAVAGIAAVDEARALHEEVGYWVQRHVEFLPSRLKFYTDDLLILGGAFAGACLLFWLIKRTGRLVELAPYIAAVVLLAVIHGLLDIVSHKTVMLEKLFPGRSKIELSSLEHQFSVFEEYCKVWSAWFVMLFVQRLFHRDRVGLAWSWIVCLSLPLAAFSLWQWTAAPAGIPYLRIGGPLEFIRNFHGLVELSFVWVAWTLASWLLLREREHARNWFALLFPISAVLLAGGWSNPERLGAWVATIADALLPNAYWDADFFAYNLLAAVFLGPALVAGWLMARAVRLGWIGMVSFLSATAVAAVGFGKSSVFVLVGLSLGIATLYAMQRGASTFGVRNWRPASAIVLLISAAILLSNLAPLIPNYRFKDRDFLFFCVKRQLPESVPSR